MNWGEGEIARSGDNRYQRDFSPSDWDLKRSITLGLSPRRRTIDLNFALKTAQGMLCFVILSPEGLFPQDKHPGPLREAASTNLILTLRPI